MVSESEKPLSLERVHQSLVAAQRELETSGQGELVEISAHLEVLIYRVKSHLPPVQEPVKIENDSITLTNETPPEVVASEAATNPAVLPEPELLLPPIYQSEVEETIVVELPAAPADAPADAPSASPESAPSLVPAHPEVTNEPEASPAVIAAPTRQTVQPPPLKAPPPPMIKPKSMRLPNGNATRAYSAALGSVLKIPLERLEWLDPWPAGLSLSEQMYVAGTPEVAGEYVVRWRRVGESAVEGEFLLTINADPRSLWKDLPSDRSDPFWKEDSDKKQGGSAVANVVAASVRGRSHAHVGSFRDDDFGMHLPPEDDPNGWHLLCVADGAGSAKSSRRGSQVACNVIIEKLKELLVDSPEGLAAELDARSREAEESEKADSAFWTRTLYHVLGTAVGHAQAAVRKEADALGVSIKEFSTTLLVSIVRRTTKNAWFVGTYWVGDGAIGMWSPEWAAPKLFGEPETGEYAGQTTFFTSEDLSRAETVQKRLRYTLVQDFGFLALMTDGISDPKFPTEQMLKMPAAWATFQEDINAVLTVLAAGQPNTDQQLLDWMDFWSAGNHDDRTLLLLVPRAAEVETN